MREEFEPDPPLSADERERVATLSQAQTVAIDNALLGHASSQWRKVAYLVGMSMSTQEDRLAGIPDLYYAERVRDLVNRGLLEAHGNLAYMRFSEVRIPVLPGASPCRVGKA
jgi:hypothetical protein